MIDVGDAHAVGIGVLRVCRSTASSLHLRLTGQARTLCGAEVRGAPDSSWHTSPCATCRTAALHRGFRGAEDCCGAFVNLQRTRA